MPALEVRPGTSPVSRQCCLVVLWLSRKGELESDNENIVQQQRRRIRIEQGKRKEEREKSKSSCNDRHRPKCASSDYRWSIVSCAGEIWLFPFSDYRAMVTMLWFSRASIRDLAAIMYQLARHAWDGQLYWIFDVNALKLCVWCGVIAVDEIDFSNTGDVVGWRMFHVSDVAEGMKFHQGGLVIVDCWCRPVEVPLFCGAPFGRELMWDTGWNVTVVARAVHGPRALYVLE